MINVEVVERIPQREANLVERIEWMNKHVYLFSPRVWKNGSTRAAFPDGPLNEASYVLAGLRSEMAFEPTYRKLLSGLTELHRVTPSYLTTQPYSTLAHIYLSEKTGEKHALQQKLMSFKLPSPTLDRLFFVQELDTKMAIAGYDKVVDQLISKSIKSDLSGYTATHVVLYSTRFFSSNARLSQHSCEELFDFICRCIDARELDASLDLLLELLASYLYLANTIGSPKLNDTRVHNLVSLKLNEEKCQRARQDSDNDLDPNIYHQCLAAVLLSRELLRIASDRKMKGVK